MGTQHTAGPWKAQIARSGSNRIQVSGADGRQVALIWRHSAAETEANKLLVRSSPELLAVLHEVEIYLSERSDVIDGDYGQPAPNAEMVLLAEVQSAIRRATACDG